MTCELEFVVCEICGNQEYVLFKQLAEWSIVRCENCGLKYLNPRPSQSMLAELYTTQYFNERVARASDEEDILQFYPLLERIGQYLGRKGRILEIGCGRGHFLAAAERKGWQATGLDISQDAVDYAVKTLGVDAVQGTPESWTTDQVFDFVVTFHAIEHLSHPLNSLQRVRSFMHKEDSAILVRVPNVDSIDRHWHNFSWYGWQPPYHLWHFGPRTLSKLLMNAGFTKVTIETGLFNPFHHLMLSIDIKKWRGDCGSYKYSDYAGNKVIKSSLRLYGRLFRLLARPLRLRLKRTLSDRNMDAWAA